MDKNAKSSKLVDLVYKSYCPLKTIVPISMSKSFQRLYHKVLKKKKKKLKGIFVISN